MESNSFSLEPLFGSRAHCSGPEGHTGSLHHRPCCQTSKTPDKDTILANLKHLAFETKLYKEAVPLKIRRVRLIKEQRRNLTCKEWKTAPSLMGSLFEGDDHIKPGFTLKFILV